MADDAELAGRATAGDKAAAAEIYDRYAPLVRAVLLDATGSLPEADDLAQEVFLRAFARLGQLRDKSFLCGWLLGIARREGIDYRRRMARQRRRFTPLVDQPRSVESAASRDTIDFVRQAIRELPERERMAVHIHYLCEEPAEAARAALGLSASGFYKLLERARARLRKQLVKTGGKR